jgi:ferredoxin
MAVLNVIDREGRHHALDTAEGWRVMELLRDQNVGVEGICGGACDCASCHVIVAPDWADRLPTPREEELFKLEELPVLEPTSRLSCQIIWSDALDGLTLRIAEAG